MKLIFVFLFSSSYFCFLAFSDKESPSGRRFFLSYFTQEVKPIYARSSTITNSTETLIPLSTITSQRSLAAQEAIKKHSLQQKGELSVNRAGLPSTLPSETFHWAREVSSFGPRRHHLQRSQSRPASVYSDRIPAGPINYVIKEAA